MAFPQQSPGLFEEQPQLSQTYWDLVAVFMGYLLSNHSVGLIIYDMMSEKESANLHELEYMGTRHRGRRSLMAPEKPVPPVCLVTCVLCLNSLCSIM